MNTSFRYIVIGSSIFSPWPNAPDGAVGVSSASTLLERLGEIAQDQRADFLRAQVIGVVIAGRQHIRADHDAPPHLGAEAGGARAFIQVAQILAIFAQAEPNAIITRQVGRRLGGRDDVVRREPVFRVRQRDIHDFGAGLAQPGQAALPQRLDSAGMPSERYSRGTPMRRPFTPRAQAASKSGTGTSALVDPSGRSPPSSPAGSRCPAPCARTGRDDRATRRRPPRPSASTARRSA